MLDMIRQARIPLKLIIIDTAENLTMEVIDSSVKIVYKESEAGFWGGGGGGVVDKVPTSTHSFCV